MYGGGKELILTDRDNHAALRDSSESTSVGLSPDTKSPVLLLWVPKCHILSIANDSLSRATAKNVPLLGHLVGRLLALSRLAADSSITVTPKRRNETSRLSGRGAPSL